MCLAAALPQLYVCRSDKSTLNVLASSLDNYPEMNVVNGVNDTGKGVDDEESRSETLKGKGLMGIQTIGNRHKDPLAFQSKRIFHFDKILELDA